MAPRPWGILPRADDVLVSAGTTRADTVSQAHEVISELFCEHTLSPLDRTEVRMRLRSAHEAGVGIELLDYGEAVRIAVDPGLEHFYLIQIPLTGLATMEVGHALIESSPLVATVPPIDRGFTMRWGSGAPTLIVYVERSRLEAVARSVYGVESGRLQLGLHMRLDTNEGLAFLRALVEHHDVLEHATADGAYARRLSSEFLLARLLGAVDNSVSRALGAWSATDVTQPARGDVLVRRFTEAAEAAASEGVTVLEIANRLGVPLRTLQSHIRNSTGSTPSAILRDSQMRRARSLLVAADPTTESVTGIAQRSGFTHLGRFASDYRKRYGEAPGETLRR